MAVNCPAGKYCPSGTSSNQNVCPKGYYCPANSRHPTPCPKGNYCPEGASTPIQCEAGFYCPDLASQHAQCTPNFYCPVGSFVQLPCTGNTFSDAQASVCSCVSPPYGVSVPSGSDCIVTCNPGFTSYQGQCFPSMKPAQLTYLNANGTPSAVATQKIAYTCPPCYSLAGSLCSFSSTCTPICPNGYVVNQNSVCTQCPSGKQSLNNQCVDANAGFYALLGVEMACAPGTYSQAGATACTLCPAGTSSAIIGATSLATCTTCPIGTYSGSGAMSCTPCAQGTYSTSTGRTTPCSSQCRTSCPSGNYVSPACTAWANAECSSCSAPSGLQYVTGLCSGSGSTNTQFATSPSCNPGYYLSDSSSGAYNTLGSAGTCQPCANNPTGSQYVTTVCGTRTNTSIATRTCPAGQYAQGFSAGSYNTLGSAGTCTACALPSGEYDYVTGVCSMPTSNTTIATSTCAWWQGLYASGLIAGSYNTLGSAGTCTGCSAPSGTQYVTTVCGKRTNTVFATKTCPAGQYGKGFNPGSYNALGTLGTCATCTLPSGPMLAQEKVRWHQTGPGKLMFMTSDSNAMTAVCKIITAGVFTLRKVNSLAGSAHVESNYDSIFTYVSAIEINSLYIEVTYTPTKTFEQHCVSDFLFDGLPYTPGASSPGAIPVYVPPSSAYVGASAAPENDVGWAFTRPGKILVDPTRANVASLLAKLPTSVYFTLSNVRSSLAGSAINASVYNTIFTYFGTSNYDGTLVWIHYFTPTPRTFSEHRFANFSFSGQAPTVITPLVTPVLTGPKKTDVRWHGADAGRIIFDNQDTNAMATLANLRTSVNFTVTNVRSSPSGAPYVYSGCNENTACDKPLYDGLFTFTGVTDLNARYIYINYTPANTFEQHRYADFSLDVPTAATLAAEAARLKAIQDAIDAAAAAEAARIQAIRNATAAYLLSIPVPSSPIQPNQMAWLGSEPGVLRVEISQLETRKTIGKMQAAGQFTLTNAVVNSSYITAPGTFTYTSVGTDPNDPALVRVNFTPATTQIGVSKMGINRGYATFNF